MGNRASSLPISRFCGRATEHDTGSDRRATVSSAWHAKCAGAARQQWAHGLTPDELAQVEAWAGPTDIELPEGCSPPTLRYADAVKELEVRLHENGEAPQRAGSPVISVGHLDMAWVVSFPDGLRVAYVGDLKKSEFTSEVGSPQLHAYGLAYAALEECDAYCCGIWAAEEARWTWGEVVDLESHEAMVAWELVKAAALNVGGEYRRGPHCRGCYGRFQCPAHLLPPEALKGSLAVMGADAVVKREDVATLVLDIKRAQDTIDQAEKWAKDWVAQNGPVEAEGKRWGPIPVAGRESLDKAALLKEYPEAKKHWRQGKPSEQYRWVGVKP